MISTNPVVFDEKAHTYTHGEHGKLISVTTLLGKYKKPFNSQLHASRVAKREGVSTEMVLETWEAEKNKACDKGTKIHKLLEDYISFGEVLQDYGWLYKSYDKGVEHHIDKFKSIACEKLLHDDEYKVAGTADLIYEHSNDEFTLGDFKTNKKFRFCSPFGERLLDPVDHLHNCEFNVYALQLSMYAYMHEKLTGKKCRKLVIFYLSGDRFSAYHCNYLKRDIEKILEHYTARTK
jgi:hypothetical protein